VNRKFHWGKKRCVPTKIGPTGVQKFWTELGVSDSRITSQNIRSLRWRSHRRPKKPEGKTAAWRHFGRVRG